MTGLSHTTPAPMTALDRLVHTVREAVRLEGGPDQTAGLVAAALEPFLREPDLLPPEYRIGDPEGYRQHLVHAEDDGSFSIVALVWQPRQRTEIHDHVAWCVAGVYEGAESERRYELRGAGENAHLVPGAEVVNEAGTAGGFAPPGDIHLVANDGDTPVIAVHIYGADISRLGTSVRRLYRLPVARTS